MRGRPNQTEAHMRRLRPMFYSKDRHIIDTTQKIISTHLMRTPYDATASFIVISLQGELYYMYGRKRSSLCIRWW
jgi:hypothetical protein